MGSDVEKRESKESTYKKKGDKLAIAGYKNYTKSCPMFADVGAIF